MIKTIKSIIIKLLLKPEAYARHIGVNIGNGCYISTKRFPTEPYLITIGNNVRIAGGTAFYTHGGVWTLRKIYKNPNIDTFGKISIGDNTYIGENCMIMPGVSIGRNCIIGGGSVVTKSIPDGVMAAGNPIRFIGYTERFYNRIKSNKTFCCKGMSSEDKKKYLLSLSPELFSFKGNLEIPK